MEFMNAVEQALRNYAQFSGRSDRKEFWYFMLFQYSILFAFSLLRFTALGWLLLGLFSLFTLIPGLSVSVRRLHDIGRSGLWLLMGLVPVFGWLVLVIWFCQPGVSEENAFGPPLRPAFLPAAKAGRSLGIKCISGPLRGHTYRIGSSGIVLGRAAACGVRFPDGTPGVSHQHCCIRIDQGGPILIDLNSRFGTALADGKKLPPNYPERLQPGSRFYVGSPENLCQIVYL